MAKDILHSVNESVTTFSSFSEISGFDEEELMLVAAVAVATAQSLRVEIMFLNRDSVFRSRSFFQCSDTIASTKTIANPPCGSTCVFSIIMLIIE